ncbi:MAG: SOS response-associated peptidase family protein [Stomatobaculum sp.]|nr:SOS response-associated peptidase family protein [Stomatobaculum sp.]
MCCRYWTDKSPELRAIVEEMNRSPLVSKWQRAGAGRMSGAASGENGRTDIIKTYGEIRPTDVVPVIAPDKHGNRAVFPMKWGFSGKSLLMNARSETAASRPTFKEAWEKHRCIVPASWYFEWEHLPGKNGRTRTGEKYMIRPKDSEMTWLCGLYRIENGLPVFVVLTREPGEGIRFIHDRMPLILPEKYIDEWISPDRRPEEFIPEALTEMAYQRAAV